jgi:hypothetical protein
MLTVTVVESRCGAVVRFFWDPIVQYALAVCSLGLLLQTLCFPLLGASAGAPLLGLFCLDRVKLLSVGSRL